MTQLQHAGKIIFICSHILRCELIFNFISFCDSEKAAAVILVLAKRVDGDTFSTLLQYATTWLYAATENGQGASSVFSPDTRSLVRTGAQIAGLLVSCRPESAKKSGMIAPSLLSVQKSLHAAITSVESLKDGDDLAIEFDVALSSSSHHVGSEAGGADMWALAYHLLLYLEKLLTNVGPAADAAILSMNAVVSGEIPMLMCTVQEALLYPH